MKGKRGKQTSVPIALHIRKVVSRVPPSIAEYNDPVFERKYQMKKLRALSSLVFDTDQEDPE